MSWHESPFNTMNFLKGFFLSLLQLALFQNCGGDFQTSSDARLYKSGIEVCDSKIVTGYSDSFYSLAKTHNCGSCHNNGNGHPSSFADDNLQEAFDNFSQLGGAVPFTRKALSDHQEGVTGEPIRGDLNLAKSLWDDAHASFQQCVLTSGDGEILSQTSSKATSLFDSQGQVVQLGAEETLEWELSEPGFEPELAGVIFRMAISVVKNSNGNLEYHVKEPTLIAGNQAIYVQNIDILINETKIGKTTYTFSNQVLEANSRVTFSNTSAVFQSSDSVYLNSTDKFSVHFHEIGLQ